MSRELRIKICCIASVEEARLALRCGATALGLVSAMPSGPGIITEEAIQEIVGHLPPGTPTFLLTSAIESKTIIAQCRRCRVSTVQLVDAVSTETLMEIRRALPRTSVVQVIHVTGPDAVESAIRIAPSVDAILLDSGNPGAPVRELGGTGRVHNWEISRRIVNAVALPVFLAGGLNQDNVADAVRTVNPFGVDVCSGVRTNGILDEKRLTGFIRAARGAIGM